MKKPSASDLANPSHSQWKLLRSETHNRFSGVLKGGGGESRITLDLEVWFHTRQTCLSRCSERLSFIYISPILIFHLNALRRAVVGVTRSWPLDGSTRAFDFSSFKPYHGVGQSIRSAGILTNVVDFNKAQLKSLLTAVAFLKYRLHTTLLPPPSSFGHKMTELFGGGGGGKLFETKLIVPCPFENSLS